MEESKVDFPELAGKVVTEFAVYPGSEFGREVLVRFTDGTQISIAIGVTQSVDARYCRDDTPDLPIFTRLD